LLIFSAVIQERSAVFDQLAKDLVRGPLGLAIERDLYFKPGPFKKVIADARRNRDG
jgi:hypothetical protein